MRYSLVIVALIILQVVNAQPGSPSRELSGYIFRNINNNNGLINNDVTSITQDHRGYMWLGTINGMQRYDGVRFVNYTDPTLKEGESAATENIYSDKKNDCIWFNVGWDELRRIKLQDYSISLVEAKTLLKPTPKIYTDWNGREWIINETFMQPLKTGNSADKLVTILEAGEKKPYINYILTDSNNQQVWMYAYKSNQVLLFDNKSGRVFIPNHNPINNPLLLYLKQHPFSFRRMVSDSHGNIWIYSWKDSFLRYNISDGGINEYSVGDILKEQGVKNTNYGFVNVLLEDNHGTVWIGTSKAGLLRYNSASDNFSWIVHREGNRTGIQYNFEIRTLFQDTDENIWIGSDKGVSIFNPYHKKFFVLKHEPDNKKSLPNHEISSIIETKKGDLLVGTWGGGISFYDQYLNYRKTLNFPDLAYQKNMIWSFEESDEGWIWAGTQHGFVHKINPIAQTIETIRPPELEGSTVLLIKKDNSGNTWFCLQNGKIVKWVNNKFYPFNEMDKPDSIPYARISDICIDRSGKFWVSTWNGLKLFDTGTRTYNGYYRPDKNNDRKIYTNKCSGVDEVNDSLLVVGTFNGGLNFFNKNTGRFSSIPIDRQQTPYSVHAVRKDKDNNIWLTTDYDIYKFFPASLRFISAKTENGLINSSFALSRFYKSKKSQWFTWTTTEMLAFYPDSLNMLQASKTPVTITGFKVFDKTIIIDSLFRYEKELRLNHRQNFITIEFADLEYNNEHSQKYYYQLSGVDEQWVDAGTKSFASYTSLSPGRYTFRVKQQQDDENKSIASFSIIIEPPFWKTWWFTSLSVLVLLVTAWILVVKRIKFIRHEAELKHKMAETEMRALRAQMNPHFIFNCLNAIDNLIQTNQKGRATTYLNRFARLIRSVLDSSKNNLVPFHKDYETLKLFLELEQFRCDHKFDYELKADQELLTSDYNVPPLIIQPFVENAIHHGLMNKQDNERFLLINISLENDYIKYVITDNGIGREMAATLKAKNRPEHAAYGIEMTRHRVDLHNRNGRERTIYIHDLIKDKKTAGTKVELWLAI